MVRFSKDTKELGNQANDLPYFKAEVLVRVKLVNWGMEVSPLVHGIVWLFFCFVLMFLLGDWGFGVFC